MSNKQPAVIQKIGFSLSRCLRDIVYGKVDLDHVALIIAGTDFFTGSISEVQSLTEGYVRRGVWRQEHSESYKTLIKDLERSKRLLQPRRDIGDVLSLQGMYTGVIWADLVLTDHLGQSSQEAYKDFIITTSITE